MSIYNSSDLKYIHRQILVIKDFIATTKSEMREELIHKLNVVQSFIETEISKSGK